MKDGFSRGTVSIAWLARWGLTSCLADLPFIRDHNQNTIFLMGPGHGGPAGTAQSLLDGTYRETYPFITER